MKVIDYIKGRRDELSPVQQVNDPVLDNYGIRLLMKRDDLIHPIISGNKWRKLRYHLTKAATDNHHTVLTLGGAFSNHIAATAQASFNAGLDSIGIIRGDELARGELNPTLRRAKELGMELHFISRAEYRMRGDLEFVKSLRERFGRFHLIPEGGADALGVKGCTEILPEVAEEYDIVACAAGTGTTLAGLLLSLPKGKQLMGFPALKGGEFLRDEILRLYGESGIRPASGPEALRLETRYHFGGYAQMTDALQGFIAGFYERTGIPLDPVYTGKMMFGIYDLLTKRHFEKGNTVLALHTGGLQGWGGMKP